MMMRRGSMMWVAMACEEGGATVWSKESRQKLVVCFFLGRMRRRKSAFYRRGEKEKKAATEPACGRQRRLSPE
jgi:hypothetical protein